MNLFDPSKVNVPFMKYRIIAVSFSVIFILASFVSLFVRGINLSVDFTGGIDIQVKLIAPAAIDVIRQALNDGGFTQAAIQIYDEGSISIRYQESDEETQNAIVKIMEDRFGKVTVEKIDKVGPVVGKELRKQTQIAVTLAILGMLAYMAVRFTFRFGVAAVLALVHDSIVMVGSYSLTGREVGPWFIAAVLTIIGISLNDTIVILDRVRENWPQLNKVGIVDLMNNSINQTLSRTVNTALLTLFPVLAMYFLGVEVMSNLAFAFLIGTIFGTYSSFFVTTTVVVEWYLRKPQRR